jgi:signal transduction histidine kinase
MRLTLRQKINIIVGTAATAFVFLMAVSWYLNVQMEGQTAFIRDQYIPHVELGYRLEMQFHGIGLSLRDAVSAQDINGLETTLDLKNRLLHELEASSKVVEARQITNLKTALDDYVSSAMSTSRRLIAGETGLGIVAAMTEMQAKQAAAASVLSKVTTFDRGSLREAFASISQAQERSARIRFWVSVGCVLFIFVVSLLMGRSLISRLKEISSGLTRFGEGDFSEPIPVVGEDELADLSRHINKMALRIQSLVRELESFSYSVAHDLRSPIRGLMGFSVALLEDHALDLSDEGKSYLNHIAGAAQRMGHMVDGLLSLSRLNRAPLHRQQVNLSQIVATVIEVLKGQEPERRIHLQVEENVAAWGDPQLLDIAISNLIGNAWKFTKRRPEAQIHFGSKKEPEGLVYFVRDNGAGFDMRYRDKLFGTFQRLHSESEFEGHGIGLATVKNVIDKHGGRIWAESEVGKGTVFYFMLG